jgi:mannose/fructose/N-acetylgalactosamine-specific phosphotransferase system component IID
MILPKRHFVITKRRFIFLKWRFVTLKRRFNFGKKQKKGIKYHIIPINLHIALLQ